MGIEKRTSEKSVLVAGNVPKALHNSAWGAEPHVPCAPPPDCPVGTTQTAVIVLSLQDKPFFPLTDFLSAILFHGAEDV
jgi:hypothetical protein